MDCVVNAKPGGRGGETPLSRLRFVSILFAIAILGNYLVTLSDVDGLSAIGAAAFRGGRIAIAI